MKKLVHLSFVALIIALFITSSTAFASSTSTKCFTFTNNENAAATDLHIELNKGSCPTKEDPKIKNAAGAVSGSFEQRHGDGSNNKTYYDGTVPNGGGSVKVCVTYDGTTPEVKSWRWSQGFTNNDVTKPIWLGTKKDAKSPDIKIIAMALPTDETLVCKATGTGRTTGNIANLSIKNTSNENVAVELGPYLIPSSGKYQPYIVPSIPEVIVPANGSLNTKIFGYCTDIHTPPVPDGQAFPPVNEWITPGPIASGWQPNTVNGWIPIPAGNLPNDVVALNPVNTLPLGHTINVNKQPLEAAPVLFEAIKVISSTFDGLKNEGLITTPFSGNPEKEKEAVIQQTFWIYAAALEGKDYEKDDFRNNTIKQFEAGGQNFNAATSQTKSNVETGVTNFWNTFEAVGVEAKVITISGEDEEDEIDEEDELPILIQPGYEKYAAARALGSSHEKAMKEAFVWEDKRKQWAETFKKIYINQGGK
jgi:hypothetical protein